MPETVAVEGCRFHPEQLAPESRHPGISAFMRIKNGADFLEATIRSHIHHVNEIVAVYNQCTDATPDILARLVQELGSERLRTFHYLPRVFPPGSDGHRREPPDGPASFVNMSNFALSRTRFTVAVKLDDDHLAMKDHFAAIAARVRAAGCRLDRVLCFSGLNLARDATGTCGILAREPFSGSGDIGFFEVALGTRFIHNPRFEDFDHIGRRRVFAGLTYWHLKYLKTGFGFANRDIDEGNPRFASKRDEFLADRRVVTLAALSARAPMGLAFLAQLPLRDKTRLAIDRWLWLRRNTRSDTEMQAVCRMAAARATPSQAPRDA